MRNASMKEPQSVYHWLVGKPKEGAKECKINVFWCSYCKSIFKRYNEVLMGRFGVR